MTVIDHDSFSQTSFQVGQGRISLDSFDLQKLGFINVLGTLKLHPHTHKLHHLFPFILQIVGGMGRVWYIYRETLIYVLDSVS